MRKILLLFVQLVLALVINAQDNIRHTTCNLNMRSQDNTSSEVILVIPQGTSVTIDEDCDCKWIPVNTRREFEKKTEKITMFATGNYRRDAGTDCTDTNHTYLNAIIGILYSDIVGTIHRYHQIA